MNIQLDYSVYMYGKSVSNVFGVRMTFRSINIEASDALTLLRSNVITIEHTVSAVMTCYACFFVIFEKGRITGGVS